MATQNVTPTSTPAPKKRAQGFAAMDPQRRREIASMGGRTAHMKGVAHEFTSEEAREAGRKGGARRKSDYLEQEQDKSSQGFPGSYE